MEGKEGEKEEETSKSWKEQSWKSSDGGRELSLPVENENFLGEGLVFPLRQGLPKGRSCASLIGMCPPEQGLGLSQQMVGSPKQGPWIAEHPPPRLSKVNGLPGDPTLLGCRPPPG